MAKVVTSPAGSEFTVDAASTVLTAAMAAGVNLPYGCGNGFCGTCKAKLLEGDISYEEGFSPDSLNAEEQDANMILCCKAKAITDIKIEVHEIEAASEIKPKEFTVKVSELKQVADDVMIMQLALGEENRMQFLAGQYIEFILDDGKRRAFSIANAPKPDGKIELHLRHIVGGEFTNKLFDSSIKPGDILKIEGPLGSFFLREESEHDVLLIAGGTGLAPIKGMLEHAIAEEIKNNIHIYWGVRDVADLYLHDELKRMAGEHKNIDYVPVLSEPAELSSWSGASGYVIDVVAENHPDLARFEVYMAGPPVMIEAGKTTFAKLGLPEDRLYSDSFEIAGESEQA